MMEENPKINVQAVVEALVERIAALELEVAVLRTMLGQQKEPQQSTEEASGEDPGQYL